MAGYFPAVPHTAIRNDFCRLYLIIEYRPVLMMYGFEYALLGAHLGAAGDTHVECILGNVDSQYCVDHCPILSSRLCTISACCRTCTTGSARSALTSCAEPRACG